MIQDDIDAHRLDALLALDRAWFNGSRLPGRTFSFASGWRFLPLFDPGLFARHAILRPPTVNAGQHFCPRFDRLVDVSRLLRRSVWNCTKVFARSEKQTVIAYTIALE